MKLSKKKITKLLKQTHQSRKQFIKKNKHHKQRNKSFRKKKTFNLRNKTLKNKKKLFGGQGETNNGDDTSPILTDLSAPRGDLTAVSDNANIPRGDLVEILNDYSLQDEPKIDELGTSAILTDQSPEEPETDTGLLSELDELGAEATEPLGTEAVVEPVGAEAVVEPVGAEADAALLAELDELDAEASEPVAREAETDAEMDAEAVEPVTTEADAESNAALLAELDAEEPRQSSSSDIQIQPDASTQATEPKPETDTDSSSPTTNTIPTDIKTVMSTTEDVNDKIFTITIRVPKSSYVQYTGDGNSAEQLLSRLTQTAGKRLKQKLTRKKLTMKK